MRHPIFLAVVCFVLASSLPVDRAACQSPRTSQSAQNPWGSFQPRPVPLAHLYWHFLMYQAYLDEKAAEREKQGQDGEWLRNSLQKQLAFTDAEFAPIRASAIRLSTEIRALDAQARSIEAADRKARTEGHVPPGTPPPGL